MIHEGLWNGMAGSVESIKPLPYPGHLAHPDLSDADIPPRPPPLGGGFDAILSLHHLDTAGTDG